MLRMQAKVRQENVGPALGTGGEAPPAGSLIIADNFIPSREDDRYGHGEIVNLAALQNGFKGDVFTRTQPFTLNTFHAQTQAESVLSNPQAKADEVLRAVSQKASAMAAGNLEAQTKVANEAAASGAKNTALNISMGTSKSSVTADLYGHAAMAWNPKSNEHAQEAGMVVAGNLAKAYSLDLSKLQSTDPKVAGPERLKLQQHLVRHVDQSFEKSPLVQGAKKRWKEAVNKFESGNNSVVISAGNSGKEGDTLVKDAHGSRVRVPRDFEKNVLEIPEVTSVGATRWFKTKDGLKEFKAKYSSRGTEVDLYASGSVDTDNDGKADTFGTSFAAPRVAATMAWLHKNHPKLSSSKIEQLLRKQMTHKLGREDVLDHRKSRRSLSGN